MSNSLFGALNIMSINSDEEYQVPFNRTISVKKAGIESIPALKRISG